MASPFQINNIACTLYVGEDGDAIKESLTPDGPRAVVRLKCPWARRYDVVRGLAGTSVRAGNVIVRIPPFAYPDSPNMRCVSVPDISGLKFAQRNDGWGQYTHALVTAEFGILPYGTDSSTSDPTGLPYTTTRFRLNGEVFTPGGGTFVYMAGVDSGKKVPEASVSFVRTHAEISITRSMMPYIPIVESMEFLASVNNAPITLGNYSFPKGCVLFSGMNATETADAAGNRTYEVEYIFLAHYNIDFNEVQDRQWNFTLMNTVVDGSGKYPFDYEDFWDNLP